MKYNYLIVAFTFYFIINTVNTLWCYECVSNTPGCGKEFNWWWHWTRICPEDDDICVKITETKNSEEVITRACLSTIRGYRTDIPADHYEGCRTAAVDLQLGHYVNNSIKELDVHRSHYQSTTFCFCFLDHRCNDSWSLAPSTSLIPIVLSYFCYKLFM